MALADQLGAVDPQAYLDNLITQAMPDAVQNGVDPQDLLNRMLRKTMQPKAAPSQPAQNGPTEFSNFGKTKEQVDQEPAADFSQFGTEEPAAPPEGTPEQAAGPVGGALSVGARSAAQAPISMLGGALKGAALIPDQPIDSVDGMPAYVRPQDQEAVDQAKAQIAATPTNQKPLYKAGQAVEDFAKSNIPVSDAERQAHPIAAGFGGALGGVAAPLIVGAINPAAGIAGAAALFGLSGAGATYDAAKAKGADEATAKSAAALSGAVNAALGSLPVANVLKPFAKFMPEASGWAMNVLAKAAENGLVFGTVGEAQEFLGQQIGKLYDSKAGYDLPGTTKEATYRLMGELLAGGALGAGHAAVSGRGEAAQEAQPAAEAQPGQPMDAASGLPPPGEAGAQAGAQTGPQPQPGTGGAGAAQEPPAEPFKTGMAPKMRQTLEENAVAHGEHSASDVAAWSDDHLKEYVNSKFGGGKHAGAEPSGPTPGTRENPIDIKTAADVERAVRAGNENYSHAQGEANNIPRVHGTWNGLPWTMETGPNNIRRFTNPETGELIETTMGAPYGYFKNTVGGDGQHLDVYFGPKPEGNPPVYIIDEIDRDTGKFRQHKSFVGFSTPQEAVAAYTSSTGKAHATIGGMRAMSANEFKSWVKEGDTKAPLSEAMTGGAKGEGNPSDVGKAGSAIVTGMYDKLWDAANRGEVNEGGKPSTILQAAKMVRGAGGLKTRAEFEQFAQDYAKIERGPQFQSDMRALVDRWQKQPTSTKTADVTPADTADNPSAEPLSDIKAQVADLNDDNHSRAGVYLPPETLEHMRAVGQSEQHLLEGRPVLENFDGKGGALVVRDEQTAKQALADRDNGVPMQTIVGRLTGAGGGKPAGAKFAVQQRDAQGNVTQERGVTRADVNKTKAEFEAPGRTVHVVPIAEAIERRANLVSGELSPQAGPEHVKAVEGALRQAGVDPKHVRPADIQRAAEIHAEEGAPADEAFPVAVVRNLVDDGHLTPEQVKESVGDAAAKDILEARDRPQRGVHAETPSPAVGGATAPAAGGLDQGGGENARAEAGQSSIVAKPAGSEAGGIERGQDSGGAGHPENGRGAPEHTAGGQQHAASHAEQPVGGSETAAEHEAAKSAEGAVARQAPEGFELSHLNGKWSVTDPDGHRVPGSFKSHDDAVAAAKRAAEHAEAGELGADDLHEALAEAKIPLDLVDPAVEDRAVIIMNRRDFKGHPLDALEAALVQIEREHNDVPEQLLLHLGAPIEAIDEIDRLDPSRNRQAPAAESGGAAEPAGKAATEERQPASGAGESAEHRPELGAAERPAAAERHGAGGPERERPAAERVKPEEKVDEVFGLTAKELERKITSLTNKWNEAKTSRERDSISQVVASYKEELAKLEEGSPKSPEQEAEKQSPAAVKGQERTLKDFGKEPINGYDDETGEGASGPRKKEFLKDASDYLKVVARGLEQRGFGAHLDRKGKPSKPVSINEGGAAGSGDVSLTMHNPDTGANVHVNIGGTGVPPMRPNFTSLVARVSAAKDDRFASKGGNTWLSPDLSAGELIEKLAEMADRAEALAESPAKPHLNAQEAPHGISPSVPGSHAQPSAEDVQRPVEVGGTGSIRGAESARGEPAVRATDEGRAEAAERVPTGAVREGSGREGEGGPHPVPEHAESAEGRSERAVERAADGVAGENYHIEPGALDEARGPKRKATDNVAAIELAKRLEEEGRPATHAEQDILAKYVGWGGIKGAFPDADGKFGKGYEAIGAKLQELLPADEYKTARRSIQYAHYTAEKVVRSMWDAAERLGITGGQVFEPGMGVGNFAGMMPSALRANGAHYQGIELDHTTARIAKLLYPKFGIRQADFTRAPLPHNAFDLVIGNPPFADVVIKSDPAYAKHGFFLHDYFFAKSLDAVRPGGLLAFISSAGTMNKIDPSAREYLADRADLVGAIRLPSDAFKENAGTEVTTDIIFLRKRLPGEAAGDRTWTETVKTTLPNKEGKPVTGAMSRYFAEHPEMVLGEQGFFDKLYEGRYAVRAKPGADLEKLLGDAIERLPRDVVKPWDEVAEPKATDFTTTERKEGTFYVGPNGQLHQVRGGAGIPLARRGSGIEGGVTGAAVERIHGLIPVRDALREVYAANLADDAKAGDMARGKLNKGYDAFVEKFGPINKADLQRRRPTSIQAEGARAEAREEARYAGQHFDEGTFDASRLIAKGATTTEVARARKQAREQAIARGQRWDEGAFDPEEMPDVIVDRRPNIDPFMDDPESYRLRAIEHYDDGTHQAKKSAVFFENTITRQKAPEINSTNDALLHTLNQKGRVDIPEIARLAGKSESEVIGDLGDAIFKEPGTLDSYVTRDEYLSGNVRDKLAIAKAEAEKDRDFKRNVEALEAAQPAPLAPSQITATLGMPWIPEPTIDKFAADELGLEGFKATYIPALAQWVTKGDKRSAAAVTTWGTDRRAGPDLVEDVLNRRGIKIYDQVRDADGNTRSVLNVEATQAAQDKAQAIKDKFDSWIWADPERAESHAALYNEKYNNLVVRNYDGSYLSTPGVSTNWSWRPHQTRVIARIIQSGNTYMAHAVGAGKTSAMIGAGMEMRRLGLVRKPMYVVPNHMLAQFAKEFYEQYPTAKIAIADERRFHTDRRKQFIANVANEDLDGIIITHSAFGMIPVSHDFADGVVQKEIEHYRDVLEQIPKDQEHRITRSRVEKQIERLEQRLAGKGNQRKDQTVTFEEMGVDFAFIDEAHMFRKLDFTTQMGNVKGISPEGSQMAWDLYVKSLYLDTINPERNLVLASGTPVTNTMAELFTVSRYLQRHELEQRGLAQFDAWAASFGEPVTELEQDAAGGYKPVSRFSRFVNVSELSAMVRQMMDVVTSRQLEQYVVRPKIKNGKRTMRLAEKSPALARYQEGLAQRMRLIQERRGPPKKGDDIMLSVINDGRHAAIDMRLVGAKDDPHSKLSMLVDDVFKEWKATKKQKFYGVKDGAYDLSKPAFVGPGTQMVFVNLGLSGARGFAVPDFIRSELVRRGVPKSEIAYIGDYKSHVQKQRLFNDMNAGTVRILIGSVAKMGTGVNAQRRITRIGNMDPLWYPSDDDQRNGRGIRQGNMNPEIEIADYSTKGTYDSTMWGMMERKARFIQGFFEGDPSLRSMDDLGEASQYEQAKAITTNDPRLIELTDLKQQLEKANRRWSAFDQELHAIKSRRAGARSEISYYNKRIADVDKDIAQRQDIAGDKFKGRLGSKTYDKRVEFGDALHGALDKLATKANKGQHFKIGEIAGFPLVATVRPSFNDSYYADVNLQLNGEAQRSVKISESNVGTVRSIEAVLSGLETDREDYEEHLAKSKKFIAESEDAAKAVFTGQDEINELSRKVRELQAEMTKAATAEVHPPEVNPATISSLAQLERFGWTNELEPFEQPWGIAAEMAGAPRRDQTQTPEFKRWFGDSKVVDKNGAPKVVYHGTDADFSTFEHTEDIGFHFGNKGAANARLGQTRGEPPHIERHANGSWEIVGPDGIAIGGAYPSRAAAARDAARNFREWDGANVMPVYLKVEHPLRFPDLHDWGPGAVLSSLREKGLITAEEHLATQNGSIEIDREYVARALAKKGYDGIVYRNQQEGRGDSYIVFDPSQIKSATGNRGTFDPNSPHMAEMAAPAFQPSRGLSDEAEQRRLAQAAERRSVLTARLPKTWPTIEGQQRLQIAQGVADIVHRIAGPGIEVRFADTLPSKPIGWGDQGAGTAGGKYLPLEDAIHIALGDPHYNDQDTVAFHESWHAVEDHFLSDPEMALLKREEPRLRAMAAKFYGYTPAEAAQLADFEVRAIAFQAYAGERAKGGNGAGLHIGMRGIFERLLRLFRQIANYLRGLGFHTVESIFGKAHEGQMAERPSRKLDEGQPSRIVESLLKERMKQAMAPEAAMAKPPVEAPEKVVSAAVRVDGRVFADVVHSDAAEKAMRELGSDAEQRIEDGYITSNGRFVDRNEAWRIADRNDQIDKSFLGAYPKATERGELHADALKGWDDADIERNNAALAQATSSSAPGARHPKEYLTVDGKPAWGMVIDKLDNAVLDTVRYADAADADFHHNFYLSPALARKVSDGEASFIWGDHQGLQSMEDMPAGMRQAVAHYYEPRGPELSAEMAAPPPRSASGAPPKRSIPTRIRDAISNALESRFANKLIEGTQDLSHPVRVLQDLLEERRGSAFNDLGDFYTRKRLYPGRVGNEVREFDKAHLDPLTEYMKKNAISLDAAGDYVYAKHVAERNARLGALYPPDHQFNKAMHDPKLVGASGQSQEWADSVMREAARLGKTAQFEHVANEIQRIRQYVLDKLVNGQLIDQRTADQWRNQYQHYVDLRGFEDAPDEAPSDYREPRRFNVRGKEIKQAFGRRSKADNPIVNMLDQAYRSIDRAERNRYLHSVWNALGRMNAENPGSISDIVRLDEGKPKKVISAKTGLVKMIDDSSYAGSPNTVTTKINGAPHHMLFENRDLAEAVKRMSPEGLGMFQGLLNVENKLKSLWTHYSPDFLFRHFMFRYPIEGTLNSFEQKEGGAHSVSEYLRNGLPFIGRASKAIFAANKGVRSSDPEIAAMQDYYKEMAKAGGAMMFRQSRDIDLLKEHLQTQLMALKGKPITTAREKWRRSIEAMDVVTNTLDNALRLAAFASARKQGKTPQQAALIAREATVDFQLKGKWANAIGLWFPFGNVAIQTGMRMVKAVYRSKIMRRTFMGTMLAGFLAAMFNYLIGGNDTDGVPFFEKIPEWDRRLNFIVLNPFDRDEKGRPIPIKIPMPYNWAFPLMLGYSMGTRVFGKEALRKTLGMVVRSGMEVATPFGQEENMAAMLAPELTRPAIYLATNEDYAGRPIHANPDYQKGPNAESGKKDIGGRVRTGEGWKYIARSANDLSGGNRVKSGYLDFYPEDYRQIFNYVAGSQFRLGQNIYQTGKSIMQGEAPDPTHVPLERVVRGTDYDAANRSLLYERLNKQKHPWLH